MDGSIDPDQMFSTDDEKTFSNQINLPSLPVPDLGHTLERYLDSVKPHVTPAEYRQTEFIVQQFATGVGKELHQKLLQKAENSRNWLAQWWDNVAYLEGRYPVAPFVNFGGPGPYIHHAYPPEPGTQISRAGMILYSSLKFWELIRKERLRIDRDSKGNKLCMNQFHRAYSTCRIPGVQIDHLSFNFKTESEGPTPRHFVTFYRGRIFSFDCVDEDYEVLTPLELSCQLQRIKDYCQARPEGAGVAALTGLERTPWAEVRNRLIALNPENFKHLRTIETSIFTVILDDGSPTNDVELFQDALGGSSTNRWLDKSFNMIFYENGTCASNCDHTPVDAMVLVASTYYNDLFIGKTKGIWQGSKDIRDLPQPKELVFHLDAVIQNQIITAKAAYIKVANNLQCYTKFFTKYGKQYLRGNNLHPDTHVQLALQFAYYKLYKKPAPTYETATTRRFYHARTETMRSCTNEALEWSKAMCDKKTSVQTKYNLYIKAANKHNKLMSEAQENQGCDRHLLGLYILAREQGIDMPQIFTDSAYSKSGGGGNFVLSTSFVGYTTVYGGVAPMTDNGYGCFYHIEPDKIVAVVTAWRSNKETDAVMFLEEIYHCLEEMREVIDKGQAVQAKL